MLEASLAVSSSIFKKFSSNHLVVIYFSFSISFISLVSIFIYQKLVILIL